MKMSEAFPTKYVAAADLHGDINMTIQQVVMETIGNPPENRPVVYFLGAQKGLVLNKTNGQTIADQHGDDADHWQGKQITLFPTSTDFQGRQVACIRVRPAMGGGYQGPPASDSKAGTGQADPRDDDLDDEIPF